MCIRESPLVVLRHFWYTKIIHASRRWSPRLDAARRFNRPVGPDEEPMKTNTPIKWSWLDKPPAFGPLAEHKERFVAADARFADAAWGGTTRFRVVADDVVYDVKVARVMPGEPFWGQVLGTFAKPLSVPRDVRSMPEITI